MTPLRALAAAVAMLLALPGCSTTAQLGADSEPTSTALPEPTSTALPTPSADATDSQRAIPPLSLPATAPGSDEAFAELIAELERFLEPEQLATVPWPDLRNPDPIAVYRSCAEFQNWMMENNPSPSLVGAYTAPGSPERGWDVDMFARLELRDARSTPSDPPYSMDVRGLVHPAAADITDALLAQLPEGSAAVVYWDTVGRSQIIGPDGSILRQSEGWTNQGPWVAIMAPTDVGWQVWWDELTETPPPGLDDDRGAPQTPEPRLDL